MKLYIGPLNKSGYNCVQTIDDAYSLLDLLSFDEICLDMDDPFMLADKLHQDYPDISLTYRTKKLFIDDLRPCPDDFTIVRSYDKAIKYIDTFDFDFISVDYDLCDRKNGLDILKHMVKTNHFPQTIRVHSTHIQGYPKMKKYLENFPDTVQISQF